MSHSSAEVEYIACCHVLIVSVTIIYCYNVIVVYMIVNHVHHHLRKHIEIYIHFICKKVTLGYIVHVPHVPSSHVQLFTEFSFSLCICDSPTLTASG